MKTQFLMEMFSINNTVNPINTYSAVPPSLTLDSTPPKLLKKSRKTRRSINIDKIKISQSNTTASARFLSTYLHSVSQAIILSYTEKITLYNQTDTACCADSGTYKDMFPD